MLMGLSLWAERAGRRNRFAGEYFLGDRSLKGLRARHDARCDLRIRLLLRFGARPCLATRPRLGGLRRAADHRGLSDSRRGRQEDGRRLARRGGADRHRHDPRTLRRRPGRTDACGAARSADARLLHDDDDRSVHRRRTDLLEGRGRELRLGARALRCRHRALHGLRRLQGRGRYRHGLRRSDARGHGRARLEHPRDGRRTRPGDGERRRSSSPRGGQ